MKNINFFLVLLVFSLFSLTCNADYLNYQSQMGSKVNVGGFSTSDVAANANKMQPINTEGGAFFQDPLLNGAMNGYYTMMQGATGGSSDMQEIQKQQLDYARQQTKNDE